MVHKNTCFGKHFTTQNKKQLFKIIKSLLHNVANLILSTGSVPECV